MYGGAVQMDWIRSQTNVLQVAVCSEHSTLAGCLHVVCPEKQPHPKTWDTNKVWCTSLFGAIKFKHGKQPTCGYEFSLNKEGMPTSKKLRPVIKGSISKTGYYLTTKAPFIIGVWKSGQGRLYGYVGTYADILGVLTLALQIWICKHS